MESRQVSGKQSIHYRNYRRARDKALVRSYQSEHTTSLWRSLRCRSGRRLRWRRSVRTRHLQLVSQEHSVTTRTRSIVSSPYGPVNPASTTLLAQETLRANQEARLLELLSSLESVVESLNYKSFTAYDTLVIATEGVRVALSNIVTDEAGTDADRS